MSDGEGGGGSTQREVKRKRLQENGEEARTGLEEEEVQGDRHRRARGRQKSGSNRPSHLLIWVPQVTKCLQSPQPLVEKGGQWEGQTHFPEGPIFPQQQETGQHLGADSVPATPQMGQVLPSLLDLCLVLELNPTTPCSTPLL